MCINKYGASCVWCWQLGGLVLVITLCSYSLHSAVQELIPNSTHKAHTHSLLIASQETLLPPFFSQTSKLSALLDGYTVLTLRRALNLTSLMADVQCLKLTVYFRKKTQIKDVYNSCGFHSFLSNQELPRMKKTLLVIQSVAYNKYYVYQKTLVGIIIFIKYFYLIINL